MEDQREAKIKSVALAYYSRKDVEKAIHDFCLRRETVPRYMEGFGKRPNVLEYPSEILILVKNGATSFHCSEERWKDVMAISTDKDSSDLEELREGWDLLIDIDSKYFDVSKYAAMAIINSLEEHGVNNIGVKFSGNKGWHIIVPWEAFPKEMNGVEMKKKFPEVPRKIVEYLMDHSNKHLERYLSSDKELWENLKKNAGKIGGGVKCEQCKNIASEFYFITLTCPNRSCRTSEQIKKTVKEVESSENDASFKNGKRRKCIQCSSPMEETSRIKFYLCETCKIDSRKSPQFSNVHDLSIPQFSNFYGNLSDPDIRKELGLDVILVSSRHLFRSPYSLHEKTALASVVIDKSKVSSFSHKDADPVRVSIKNFMPRVGTEEAKELLIKALDWSAKRTMTPDDKKESREQGDFKEIKIDRSKLKYPPSIETILKGMVDGRKRALFIIINYFKSLNFSEEEVAKIVDDWNKKNKKPLMDGYLQTQVQWSFKQKKLLPPNYDKPYYKGIGIFPTDEELKFKNPVSYTIRKMFSSSKGKSYKN